MLLRLDENEALLTNLEEKKAQHLGSVNEGGRIHTECKVRVFTEILSLWASNLQQVTSSNQQTSKPAVRAKVGDEVENSKRYAGISSHRNSGRPLMQKDNIITHLETLISLLCGKQSKRALGGELLRYYHRRCKWQDFTFLGQIALHWLQLFHFPNTFSEQLSFMLIPHFGCYILNSAAMNLGV